MICKNRQGQGRRKSKRHCCRKVDIVISFENWNKTLRNSVLTIKFEGNLINNGELTLIREKNNQMTF